MSEAENLIPPQKGEQHTLKKQNKNKKSKRKQNKKETNKQTNMATVGVGGWQKNFLLYWVPQAPRGYCIHTNDSRQ